MSGKISISTRKPRLTPSSDKEGTHISEIKSPTFHVDSPTYNDFLQSGSRLPNIVGREPDQNNPVTHIKGHCYVRRNDPWLTDKYGEDDIPKTPEGPDYEIIELKNRRGAEFVWDHAKFLTVASKGKDRDAELERAHESNRPDSDQNPLPLPFPGEEHPPVNPYYLFHINGSPEDMRKNMENTMKHATDGFIIVSLLRQMYGDDSIYLKSRLDNPNVLNWPEDFKEYFVWSENSKIAAYSGFRSDRLGIKIIASAWKDEIKAPDDQQSFPSDINFGIDLRLAADRDRKRGKVVNIDQPPKELGTDAVVVSNIVNEVTREAMRHALRAVGINVNDFEPDDHAVVFSKGQCPDEAWYGLLGTPILNIIMRGLKDFHNAYQNRIIAQIHVKFSPQWYDTRVEESQRDYTKNLRFSDPADGSFEGMWSLGVLLVYL